MSVNAFTSKPVSAVKPVLGDRINAARLISVMLMMYVHVPTGQTGETIAGNAMAQLASTRLDHWLESILIEGPGRASAALLSVVSGYLAATTLMRVDSSVIKLYRRRFFSIVVPMICWAMLTWIVYMTLGQREDVAMSGAHSWLDKINVILFLTDTPYGPTMHLGFLRDLFVCVLLSPLLLFVLNRAALLTIGVLTVFYLVSHSVDWSGAWASASMIILRPLVILGFTIGMVFALKRTLLEQLDDYWAVFLFLTGVLAVFITWTNAGMLAPLEGQLAHMGISLKESVLYPLCRLTGSLAIWCMLPLCMGNKLKWVIDRCSPYLFAAFCSHFLVLSILFHGLWEPLAGDRDSFFYFAWFISAPAISMVCAIAMVNMLVRIYPPLAALITGGRLAAQRSSANSGSGGRTRLAHAS